jgi:MFS family permease
LAGTLTDTVGARTVAIGGFIVMGAATVPFALADANTSTWWLMAVLLLRGFGMGAVMIPVMSVAFVGLERAEVAHASIITRLAQQVGGAFGTALLAVILESATSGATGLADLAHGFDMAFWWAVGFTVVAVAVCLVLPNRPGAAVAPSPEPSPAGARDATATRSTA